MDVFKPYSSQRYYNGSSPDPSVKCASNFLHLFTEIRAWNNEDITKHTLRQVDWYISTGAQSSFASYITHVSSKRYFSLLASFSCLMKLKQCLKNSLQLSNNAAFNLSIKCNSTHYPFKGRHICVLL